MYQEVLDKCLCHHTRMSSRHISKIYDKHLLPVGLLASQLYPLLTIALSAGELGISQMAKSLCMDRTTFTRNIRVLDREGYIGVRRLADGRVKSYVATKKGKSLLADSMPLWVKAQTQVVNTLWTRHYEKGLEFLQSVQNIDLDSNKGGSV